MATIPFVIPAGQSLSNAVNIGASKVVGVIVPSTWTPASLSAMASRTGGNDYTSLFRAGNELDVPIVAPGSPANGGWNKLNHDDFSGVTFLQLQSGSVSGGLVNQAQTVTLQLITE